MCDKVMAVGRKGGSTVQMALACGVFIKTLYAWRKRHPEFRLAYDIARRDAQIFWEELGQANIENPHFNYSVWMTMMNRFPDYRQQKHIGVPTPVSAATRTVARDQASSSPE
jgi:hypothetical protein